jgi:hypothetical protein
MDEMKLLAGALALLNLMAIAFTKVLWSNFQEAKRQGERTARELAEFKLHCSESYSTKDDLAKAFDAVLVKLDRIEDKLDKKQDKV